MYTFVWFIDTFYNILLLSLLCLYSNVYSCTQLVLLHLPRIPNAPCWTCPTCSARIDFCCMVTLLIPIVRCWYATSRLMMGKHWHTYISLVPTINQGIPMVKIQSKNWHSYFYNRQSSLWASYSINIRAADQYVLWSSSLDQLIRHKFFPRNVTDLQKYC